MGDAVCTARIWDRHTPVSRPCGNKAKRGGYCGVHDPERRDAKRAETEGRWRREREDRRMRESRERENSAGARARAIRAVVAAQWGVACSTMIQWAIDEHSKETMRAMGGVAEPYIAGLEDCWVSSARALAALPTAEQIVDGDV